jgi:hypothetical protein
MIESARGSAELRARAQQCRRIAAVFAEFEPVRLKLLAIAAEFDAEASALEAAEDFEGARVPLARGMITFRD